MLDALKIIQKKLPAAKVKMVLPNPALAGRWRNHLAKFLFEIQIGNLPEALAEADVAIASTGTVTMECAFFGVPTVTLYKTSWVNYEIARRIVTVKWATMPNILANEEVFPEFIQNDGDAGKHRARRAGAVAKRIAPDENQIAARQSCFLAWRAGCGGTCGRGDFEFVSQS